jgi:hypothetical protein
MSRRVHRAHTAHTQPALDQIAGEDTTRIQPHAGPRKSAISKTLAVSSTEVDGICHLQVVLISDVYDRYDLAEALGDLKGRSYAH